MIPVCMRRISFKNADGDILLKEMEVYHVSKEEILNICLKFSSGFSKGEIKDLQKFIEDQLYELE